MCCVSRTDFDIRTALQLGNDYGYQPTIYGGDEVYRMIDEFASGESETRLHGTHQPEPRGVRCEGPRVRICGGMCPVKLQAAGIDFCLAGDSTARPGTVCSPLWTCSQTRRLQAVTNGPAKILRIDDRVGSIRVGKDADLVALSGDPWQPTSAIKWTMVAGEIYGNNESTQ